MKNDNWGPITTKYNCPRIQEYVGGDRANGLSSNAVYLLVKLLPQEIHAGDDTEATRT